jgi:hypothetical protein
MNTRCSVVRDGDMLYIQVIVDDCLAIHDRIRINPADVIHEDDELRIVGCTSHATAHVYSAGGLQRRLDSVSSVLAR